MKKTILLRSLLIAAIVAVGFLVIENTVFSPKRGEINYQVTHPTVQAAGSQILADGTVAAQNQAILHFQTGGKVVYLPFKEGDTVTEGQTVAKLDSSALEKQLSQALNTFTSARATFDQTQANSQTGVLQGQQKYNLEVLNKASLSSGDESSIIGDAAKRILDQNQANLDNSVIQVELAQNALQLATLTSPITGVLTHEDVTVSNVNVTPQTSFIISDPTSLVLQANVSENDIDFINEGSLATVSLNGSPLKFSGTVVKIYPEKVVLANGQKVYKVDIACDDLKQYGKLDQSGTVLIQSNARQSVMLIPSWTVLQHQYVWVEQNSKPVLRKVTMGKMHGNQVEITSGLATDDKIIMNPPDVVKSAYNLL